MTTSDFELLSALVDGEAVDPERLERVLVLPGARAALVEFAGLRRELLLDAARPSTGFYETRRRLQPRLRRRLGRIAAAAALIAALLLPLRWTLERAEPETIPTGAPPVADRVLRFEPGVDWIAR